MLIQSPFQTYKRETSATTLQDVLFLVALGVMIFFTIARIHMNPITQEVIEQMPGNVSVQIRWQDGLNTDVDLWVEAPGDIPVGYSNLGGKVFDLLRDDLGNSNDLDGLNFEFAYSRGMPAGEYTVNVHLYRNISGVYPIFVDVSVGIKKKKGVSSENIFSTKIKLKREDEELTVVRFKLDSKGNLVPGSVNVLPKALRGRK